MNPDNIIQAGRLVILDEASHYYGNPEDDLKEQLRDLDGVPNATYWVKDGQVFVFAKLVKLVRDRLNDLPDMPLIDLARSLIPLAMVSAKEAVTQWGIVPEPYKIDVRDGCDVKIQHTRLNSFLPGAFKDWRDLENTLESLLLGNIRSGSGEFIFRDQPMSLYEPINIALLPSRPFVRQVADPERVGYSLLHNVTYKTGFAPVSESLFDAIKELEVTWKNDITRVSMYARKHVAEVWAQATSFQLDTLIVEMDNEPEHEQQDVAEVRTLYPELDMLSDGALYELFDEFQREWFCIMGWTASRDDEFLFYLLGKVVKHQKEMDTDTQKYIDLGQWFAYAVLNGDPLEAAVNFAHEASLYDIAISRLAARVAEAMKFISESKDQTEQRGKPITTVNDIFRASRMGNSNSMVTQRADENT